MATYAEYLKSQGASDEDVKALDHPVARRAWEASQADLVRAQQERDQIASRAKEVDAQTSQWYEQTTNVYKDMERKYLAAEADKARAIALVKSAQDQGLIEIAKGMGFDTPAAPAAAPGFDPAQYFTRDDVIKIAEREGEAIATAQDIAYQHQRLFPDKPLNFRQLRQEAVAARKSVEQVWKEKYQVDAAVSARDTADRAAYEKKLRDEGAAAERAILASQYGNPDARPLVPSTAPLFTPGSSGRDKAPWDLNEGSRSAERVQKATQAFVNKQAGTGTTH